VEGKVDNKDFFAELVVGDSTDKTTFDKVAEILKKKNKIITSWQFCIRLMLI